MLELSGSLCCGRPGTPPFLSNPEAAIRARGDFGFAETEWCGSGTVVSGSAMRGDAGSGGASGTGAPEAVCRATISNRVGVASVPVDRRETFERVGVRRGGDRHAEEDIPLGVWICRNTSDLSKRIQIRKNSQGGGGSVAKLNKVCVIS